MNLMMKHILLLAWLALVSPMARSAVDVGASSGGSCFTIVSELQRNWIQTKRYLLPGTENLNDPEDDSFVCVSRFAVQSSMERRTSIARGIRCFRETGGNGIGFCCDAQAQECAMLNPGLFPDAYRPKGKEKNYEPPKSDWVQPPSDADQWKSN